MSLEAPRPSSQIPSAANAPASVHEAPATPPLPPPTTLHSGRTGSLPRSVNPDAQLSIARRAEEPPAAAHTASHSGSAVMRLYRQMAPGGAADPASESRSEPTARPDADPSAEPQPETPPADAPAPETANGGGDTPVPPSETNKPVPGPEEPEHPKSAFQVGLEQAMDVVGRAKVASRGSSFAAVVAKESLTPQPTFNDMADLDRPRTIAEETRSTVELDLIPHYGVLRQAGLALSADGLNPALEITDGAQFTQALVTIPPEHAGQQLQDGLAEIAHKALAGVNALSPEPRFQSQNPLVSMPEYDDTESDPGVEHFAEGSESDHTFDTSVFDINPTAWQPGDELPPAVEQVLTNGVDIAEQLDRLGVDPEVGRDVRRAQSAHSEGLLTQHIKAKQLGLYDWATNIEIGQGWMNWDPRPEHPDAQSSELNSEWSAHQWERFDTLVEELGLLAPADSAVVRDLAETFCGNVDRLLNGEQPPTEREQPRSAYEEDEDYELDFRAAEPTPEMVAESERYDQARAASWRTAQRKVLELLTRS